MHILGAIAEFERERIRERVLAGLQRARAQGRRLGRPKVAVPTERLQEVRGLTLHDASKTLGVSRSTLKRWRRSVQESLST
jgi:putative DNA-invertase from lambdoid prophage Rac